MTNEKKEELFESVSGLLVNIVDNFRAKLPVLVDFDDLKQAALIRLNHAAESWRPELNIPFPYYAKHHIRGAVIDHLRELDPTTRDARRHNTSIDRAQRALEQRYMRSVSKGEVADELGIDVKELDRRRLALTAVSSIDSTGADPEERRWEPAAQRGPDQTAWHEVQQLLDDVQLTCLTTRYRKVLELYYLQEITMREIGEIMGVNESRISQILKTALQKLRAELANRGIHTAQQVLPRAA